MIPHQLHLTKPQVVKLLKGGAVVVPHKHMGAEKGEHIMMLSPQSARKLLTSYKKGKGMRIMLTPEEINHSIQHGRGFMDSAKNSIIRVKHLLVLLLIILFLRKVLNKHLRKAQRQLGLLLVLTLVILKLVDRLVLLLVRQEHTLLIRKTLMSQSINLLIRQRRLVYNTQETKVVVK